MCTSGNNNRPWALVFSDTLSSLWRQRNEALFSQVHPSPWKLATRIHNLVQDIIRSLEVDKILLGSYSLGANRSNIGWKCPSEGVFKLNCDGAVVEDRRASCGGIIRDYTGNDIFSFAKDIGDCSVVIAELWAIYFGIKTAWDRGFKNLMVEFDSQVAISLLNKGCDPSHPCAQMVRNVLDFS